MRILDTQATGSACASAAANYRRDLCPKLAGQEYISDISRLQIGMNAWEVEEEMSKFRISAAVALAAVFFAVQSASCTTLKDKFSVSIGANSGPWSGNTYTGFFTWDSSSKQGSLLSFDSDLPIWLPGEKLDVTFPISPADPSVGYSPWIISLDPLLSVSPSFFSLNLIGPDGPTFSYGDHQGEIWTVDSVQIDDPPTPEPGTIWLMALGIGVMLALVRSKRTV